MAEQLDLFTVSIAPDELAQPLTIGAAPTNQRAIEWFDAKQLYYLRMMNKFARSSHMWRGQEIGRLSKLRDRALVQLEEARSDRA